MPCFFKNEDGISIFMKTYGIFHSFSWGGILTSYDNEAFPMGDAKKKYDNNIWRENSEFDSG